MNVRYSQCRPVVGMSIGSVSYQGWKRREQSLIHGFRDQTFIDHRVMGGCSRSAVLNDGEYTSYHGHVQRSTQLTLARMLNKESCRVATAAASAHPAKYRRMPRRCAFSWRGGGGRPQGTPTALGITPKSPGPDSDMAYMFLPSPAMGLEPPD